MLRLLMEDAFPIYKSVCLLSLQTFALKNMHYVLEQRSNFDLSIVIAYDFCML